MYRWTNYASYGLMFAASLTIGAIGCSKTDPAPAASQSAPAAGAHDTYLNVIWIYITVCLHTINPNYTRMLKVRCCLSVAICLFQRLFFFSQSRGADNPFVGLQPH